MNPRTIALALAAAAPAAAQNINIDYGVGAGSPTDEYGAAADHPGYWNILAGNDDAPQPLLDTRGEPTGITVTPSLPSGPAFFDNPGTSGDDGALMDDYLDLHSHPQTFTLSGLHAGAYTVFTYAWAPDSPDFTTFVDVNDLGGVGVGGPWPGHHEEGVTYARHAVALAEGEDLVVYTFAPSHGTLNGLQIVEGEACPADLNADGALDLFDILRYTNLFNAQDPAADCTADTLFDLFDFLCYQNLFIAGCP
jgi:hypothetical protein